MSDSRSDRSDAVSGFVPIEQLRRGRSHVVEADGVDLDAIRARLAEFESTLSPDERAAFESIRGARNPALTALGALPPEDVLSPEEQEVLEHVVSTVHPTRRSLPAQIVLIMKATLHCNLRCTYCSSWSDQPNQAMPFEVLAHATYGALAAPGVRAVTFVWHGGETTLRSPSFYRKALWLQERLRRPGQIVRNSIQTNGTNLKDSWLDFLARYELSVGVSLDGPPEIHDSRRLDIAGRPTSERVRNGLERLRERGIKHGVLMVVDGDVVELGASRMLEYLLAEGIDDVSLLNVAPEGDPAEASEDDPFLCYGDYVEYLRELFGIWYPDYVDRIAVRDLSDLMMRLERGKGSSCIYGGNCVGRYFTIEPKGSVSHCDKYQQNPDFIFGNILETTLADIPASPALLRVRGYVAAGEDLCRGCPWFDICHGGCPYDRYVRVVRRRAPKDERCCGLAPLLSEMADALADAGSGATPGAR